MIYVFIKRNKIFRLIKICQKHLQLFFVNKIGEKQFFFFLAKMFQEVRVELSDCKCFYKNVLIKVTLLNMLSLNF